MKPPRVRARVSKKNHDRAGPRGLPTLARLIPHALSIGRVAEDDVRASVAGQPVIFLGEIGTTLCVLESGARIEREVKFLIKLLEELPGCRPFFRARAVERFVDCHHMSSLLRTPRLLTYFPAVTGRHGALYTVAVRCGARQSADQVLRIKFYCSRRGWFARARPSSNSLTIGLLHEFFAVSVCHLFNRRGAKKGRGARKGGQAKWRGVKQIHA
jgi:hypothetical protein